MLLLLFGCVYTIQTTLTDITAGGSAREVYATVRVECVPPSGNERLLYATLIRCTTDTMNAPSRSTSCQPVLTFDEAMQASIRSAPTTFTGVPRRFDKLSRCASLDLDPVQFSGWTPTQ